MKKTILALCMASTLFACKKETNSDSNNQGSSDAKVPVTFSVDNLSVTQQDMSINGRVESDTSLKKFSHLYYMAYASDGKIVSNIHQDTTVNKVSFGTISDTLAPGTYTIVMAISTESLVVSSFNNPYTLTTTGFMPDGANGSSVGDMFYKKTQVTITSNSNQTPFELSLNRLAGMIEFDLYDALPPTSSNGSIFVAVTNTPLFFNLGSETYTQTDYMYGVRPKRIDQTTLRAYIMGSDNPLTVDLGWSDNTGASFHKVIQNVKVNSNKKTIISGYLYGVPNTIGGGSFTMRLVQDWSNDSTVISLN